MTKPRRRSSVTDFRLVPVDVRLERRQRIVLLVGALVLLLVGLALGLALRSSPTALWHADQQSKIAALQQQLEDMRKELAVYRTDKTISNEAQDKVQQGYKELRDQLAELQEAVAFYKNIMDPADREQGLHIEQLRVQAKMARQFAFRLVLSQIGNNKLRPSLNGNVSWQLVGTQNGKPVTLAQQVFVDDGSDTSFDFRYFQELNGTLTLPAGVVPEKIIITAASGGQNAYQVRHVFNWTDVEHNNAGS